ncbi:hypothetical protein M513_12971 [Trichuris suis]|uniref:Uncharacterized protein n=1 Tax=Trichuris suis TaxID=68888 RepID=A0A085LMG7_9BILA|nr:hypothetical protein M513_12971 [Trichuris suis]
MEFRAFTRWFLRAFGSLLEPSSAKVLKSQSVRLSSGRYAESGLSDFHLIHVAYIAYKEGHSSDLKLQGTHNETTPLEASSSSAHILSVNPKNKFTQKV